MDHDGYGLFDVQSDRLVYVRLLSRGFWSYSWIDHSAASLFHNVPNDGYHGDSQFSAFYEETKLNKNNIIESLEFTIIWILKLHQSKIFIFDCHNCKVQTWLIFGLPIDFRIPGVLCYYHLPKHFPVVVDTPDRFSVFSPLVSWTHDKPFVDSCFRLGLYCNAFYGQTLPANELLIFSSTITMQWNECTWP